MMSLEKQMNIEGETIMSLGKLMSIRVKELISQIKEGLLSESEAKQGLAGWLLKYWEQNGTPVFSHNQTAPENAYYKASCSIDSGLGK